MASKAPASKIETEENVKFTILGPHGDVIGIFIGTWTKATTEKPITKARPNPESLVKDTFVGQVDDKAQQTFLASLSERRIFRNVIVLIETQNNGRHRCMSTLTVANSQVKGAAISPVIADTKSTVAA
jgi:hypothetical protein